MSLILQRNPTGIVTYEKTTSFGIRGKRSARRERLRDVYGEPVVKFQRAISIDATDPTYWLGQTGHIVIS